MSGFRTVPILTIFWTSGLDVIKQEKVQMNETPLLCIAELVIEIPRHTTSIHVMTLVAAVVSTAATLQNYRAIQE